MMSDHGRRLTFSKEKPHTQNTRSFLKTRTGQPTCSCIRSQAAPTSSASTAPTTSGSAVPLSETCFTADTVCNSQDRMLTRPATAHRNAYACMPSPSASSTPKQKSHSHSLPVSSATDEKRLHSLEKSWNTA